MSQNPRWRLEIRLTQSEKQKIEQKYQGQNISAIIRAHLLDGKAEETDGRRRVSGQPLVKAS